MLHIGYPKEFGIATRKGQDWRIVGPQPRRRDRSRGHTVRGRDVMTEPLRLRTRKSLELELRCPLPETGTGSPTQKKNVLCD